LLVLDLWGLRRRKESPILRQLFVLGNRQSAQFVVSAREKSQFVPVSVGDVQK
jgi:hypothetical protein